MQIKPEQSDTIAALAEHGLAGYAANTLIFEKGERLFSQDEPCPYIFFVTNGRAKVTFTEENGRSVLLGFYDGNGVIGELEFLSDCPATSTVVALTRVTCAAVSAQKTRAALNENLVFMRAMARELAEKLRRSSINSAANLLLPLSSRLRTYIAMAQDAGYFEENLTMLSELLGTSYRHLMRTIKALCEAGLIRRSGKGFRVPDPAALRTGGAAPSAII